MLTSIKILEWLEKDGEVSFYDYQKAENFKNPCEEDYRKVARLLQSKFIEITFIDFFVHSNNQESCRRDKELSEISRDIYMICSGETKCGDWQMDDGHGNAHDPNKIKFFLTGKGQLYLDEYRDKAKRDRTSLIAIIIAAISLAVTGYYAYQDSQGDEKWMAQQEGLADDRTYYLLQQTEELKRQNTHLQILIQQNDNKAQ